MNLSYCFLGITAEPPPDDFDKMKAAQLKAICKEFGLKQTGKKEELQRRLREHLLATAKAAADAASSAGQKDDLDAMSDDDLRDSCKARGLEAVGSREDLLERLRGDIQFAKEVAASTPSNVNNAKLFATALEASGSEAAREILESIRDKSMEDPKFMEVKITSIGMSPEKYTVGGAPSCTSDVLKKLAGDPFRDPPKYGSVSGLKRFVCLSCKVWLAHVTVNSQRVRPTNILAEAPKDTRHVLPCTV